MTELDFLPPQRPTAARPLLGLTILVVEDSRFASEALRLMCQRSGARIRRADCLRAADRHLATYRPGAVLIDPGLPDGSGLDLIARLAQARPKVSALLAISGDPDMREEALTRGADGFLEKPVGSLESFQQAVLEHLPRERRPDGPRLLGDTRIDPDPAALAEDLAHAADLIGDTARETTLDYLCGFLFGLGKASGDTMLQAQAQRLIQLRDDGRPIETQFDRLHDLVRERLSARPVAI